MADDERWNLVDRYIEERLVSPDPALTSALAASEEAGLPGIQVAPNQGKLLFILARACRARMILELGTLGGYSSIWLARALPAEGRLITLEADARHAEVATANLARAGLADRVEVRLGPALQSLPGLEADAPFDFVFIDADKVGYPDYLSWSVRLARPGALIVADNVVRDGRIVEPESDDPSDAAMRRFYDRMAAEPRLSATALQVVGVKGYDGLAIGVVTGDT